MLIKQVSAACTSSGHQYEIAQRKEISALTWITLLFFRSHPSKYLDGVDLDKLTCFLSTALKNESF